MTKEQAIENLKADIKYWENTSVSVDHLHMAIKALEQQTCDDTWSIKDVTNALTRHGLLEQEPSEKEKELNRLKAELQRAKMDAQTSYIQSPMPTSMIDKSNFNIEQNKSDLPSVTPTYGTCKDCKHCGAYLCGYTCYKGHWDKISTKGNYGGMGDFYCADFEKRGNENGRDN